ncbi:hypothetical protein AFLA_000114, partial [Aspergillus flavus NRRL3357]
YQGIKSLVLFPSKVHCDYNKKQPPSMSSTMSSCYTISLSWLIKGVCVFVSLSSGDRPESSRLSSTPFVARRAMTTDSCLFLSLPIVGAITVRTRTRALSARSPNSASHPASFGKGKVAKMSYHIQVPDPPNGKDGGFLARSP